MAVSTRHIVAIGGGGCLSGTAPFLDDYVLAQSRQPHPRIGFIPTASGNSSDHLLKFYQRFSSLDCRTGHLDFFGRVPDLDRWVGEQNIIYVGGGNTKSLLAVWKAWNFDACLRRALDAGVVLAGVSAGAICWFDYGITDSSAAALAAVAGLGFLEGSCCPHYSSEPARRDAYAAMLAGGTVPAGWAIDDGAAVHFVDGKPWLIVSEEGGASACRRGHDAFTPDLAVIQPPP